MQATDAKGLGVRRIVIIDDNPIVLLTAKKHLKAAGFEVATASKVLGTAKLLEDGSIILVDYYMPGFDGDFALQTLRRTARDSGLHCLFLLFSGDSVVTTKAIELGFDGAIADKGDYRLLVQEIERWSRSLSGGKTT